MTTHFFETRPRRQSLWLLAALLFSSLCAQARTCAGEPRDESARPVTHATVPASHCVARRQSRVHLRTLLTLRKSCPRAASKNAVGEKP
jgi:hypothetical protein